MGDKTDNTEDEIVNYKTEEDKSVKESAFSFFSFNNILSEVLRLIIYAIILSVIYFFLFDGFESGNSLQSINQLDSRNQVIGEVSVVGNEITLDEMLINTADELESHFVKVKLVISYKSQETGLEINRRMSQIYDRVRKVISSKKYTDLKYVDGQELLGLEIKTEIQKITGKVDIYNIFFRDYTVY